MNAAIGLSTNLIKSQVLSTALNKEASMLMLNADDARTCLIKINRSGSTLSAEKDFIFKSSIVTEQFDNRLFYPTNTGSFHPEWKHWIMTGASDGSLTFWDREKKNKLKTLKNEAPVSTARLSPGGEMIAYSIGNDWHRGHLGTGVWPRKLKLHCLTEQEQCFSLAK